MNRNDIADIFDVGGILSSKFPSYEFRSGQLEMAHLVSDAYNNNTIALAEAGTGIGKSFAYLVPALLHAIESPEERTVVATSTINLQKQLFEKDIPQLFSLLDITVPVALVVGRRNYLCLHRLEAEVRKNSLFAYDETHDLGKLFLWSGETVTGLKSDYSGTIPGELWDEVCSDSDLCMGASCPYLKTKNCFFMNARRKAGEAKLIITNHHLLFTDAKSRLDDGVDYDAEGVLPPFQRLVIDEAHNIERNATSFFTGTYEGREVLRQMSFLSRRRTRSRSLIEDLAPFSTEPGLTDSILDILALLTEQVGYLDTWLLTWMQQRKVSALLITSDYQRALVDFVTLSQHVSQTAERLFNTCRQFCEKNKAPQEFESQLQEVMVHVKRIQAMGSVLSQFIDFENWKHDVYWFDTVLHGKNERSVQVLISPLSIAPYLQNTIFDGLKTVICTSATLELHDEFAYWMGRVGLPLINRSCDSGVFQSPFDYKRRLMLLTPSDAPEFKEQDPEPFFRYIASVTQDAILASEGGALVLFTSKVMMNALYEKLQPMLSEHGIASYVQGSGDRFQLLHRFASEKDSVLFATESFWEGVDVPGETLRMVIIVKLPFRMPTDPVFKARQEQLDREGKSGFFHLALPEATMKLKQGFGRLMRHTMDTGIVLIPDSRLLTKTYGAWMIRALPESYHPECTSTTLTDKIENFLYQ